MRNAKENVPAKAAAVQTIPRTEPNLGISFTKNAEMLLQFGPKTPSPVSKSKVLEEVDRLILAAERHQSSMQSKLSDCLSSRNTSTNATLTLSARKTMPDLQPSSTKQSLLSDKSPRTIPRVNHAVPHNSPCSSINKKVDSRKYMKNNGEKKRSGLKVCSNQVNVNIPSTEETDQREDFYPLGSNNIKKVPNQSNERPLSTHQIMSHSQQFVNNSEPKQSGSLHLQNGAMSTNSSTKKQDSGTNTDPEDNYLKSHLPFRVTPSSSIIRMKTSKPEKEPSFVVPRQQLSIKKMPSLNIRPELTIQSGPKINIPPSSSNVYQMKRKNTELFDVLYQTNSFNSISSGVNNVGQFKMKESTFVCERHTFPSGQLIPQSYSDELRRDERSLEEKKVFLVGLIKAVTDKLEKQWDKGKTCCRLLCSLPLLASVVNKVRIECVRCVATLDRHLDTLTALMREELRSQTQMTDKQCCQLDETVQFQIVELELMEGENAQGHQHSALVQIFKYKDVADQPKMSKKSVSFESIPNATEEPIPTQAKPPFKHNYMKPTIVKSKVNTSKASLNQNQRSKLILEESVHSKAIGKKSSSVNVLAKERADQSKINKSVMKPNSILKKTGTEITKEKTIVGEVAKRLANPKPNTTMNSFGISKSVERQNHNRPNATLKIVDNQKPTDEFDQWLVDRSLKIKQIHEELNNIISESMEQYLESHPRNRALDVSSSTKKQLENGSVNSVQIDNKEVTTEGAEVRAINPGEALEPDTAFQQDTHKNPEHPTNEKDVENEYAEDFEEDIEENLKLIESSDSQVSADHTVAEADSVLSSPNTNEDVTDKEAIEPPAGADHLDKKTNRNGKKPDESTELVLLNKVNNADEEIIKSNEELDRTCNTNPEKVSIATSPIVFKLQKDISGAILIDSSTSVEGLLKKVSAATSPIISISNSTSPRQLKVSDNKVKEDESSNVRFQEDSGIQLLPPQVKLTPKSVESVLNASSSRLEGKSLEHTVNLVVHIPNITKGKDKDNQTDQTKLSPLKQDNTAQDFMKSKASIPCQSQESIREDLNKNKTELVNKQIDNGNVCNRQPLNKQEIEDIIKPTVSEVLRNIKDTSSTSTFMKKPSLITKTAVGTDNSSRKLDNFVGQCQLVKPNLTLQSRPGYCDSLVLPCNVLAKESAEASSQTEKDTQHASVQAARSLLGDVTDKAISARKYNDAENIVKSYIERLQDIALSKETVVSSDFGSSSDDLSSGSQCTGTDTSSKSSNQQHDVPIVKKDKLSDGELGGDVCHCSRGEVCSICLPNLDLSYGELKTKPKERRKITAVASDSESNQLFVTMPLLNLPLHLEPRPSSFEGGFQLTSNRVSSVNSTNITTKTTTEITTNYNSENGRRLPKTPFSDLACFVMEDLKSEHATSSNLFMNDFGDRNPTLENFSDNGKSHRSNKTLSRSKKSDISRNNSKVPLFIKPPLEVPTIDVLIEDSEASSYQTSVTSVSVDHCPSITSHSSLDLNTHLPTGPL